MEGHLGEHILAVVGRRVVRVQLHHHVVLVLLRLGHVPQGHLHRDLAVHLGGRPGGAQRVETGYAASGVVPASMCVHDRVHPLMHVTHPPSAQ